MTSNMQKQGQTTTVWQENAAQFLRAHQETEACSGWLPIGDTFTFCIIAP